MSFQVGDSHGWVQGVQHLPSQTSLCGHQHSTFGGGGGNPRICNQALNSGLFYALKSEVLVTQ